MEPCFSRGVGGNSWIRDNGNEGVCRGREKQKGAARSGLIAAMPDRLLAYQNERRPINRMPGQFGFGTILNLKHR